MLTLIDGNSLLFRAYYGVHSRLTRSDGTPTGAVYGFINMILPILAAAKPNDCFVCVFDASRQTFRQNIYPKYKANRSETPADLISQSHLIQIGLAEFGIPVLCIPGVEADDVIATLATNNCNISDQTRIITSDKDLMQLVSDCVFLYDGMKQREIHVQQVIEKFNVSPNQVIDVQSLMGDSTDNVPGVPGIGPKKAAELINQFGSLDNLYNNLDSVKNDRIKTLLSDNRDMAYISKQLVTLKTDVNLDGLKLEPFSFNAVAAQKFVKTQLESNSLSEKIERAFPISKYQSIQQPKTIDFFGSECDLGLPIETPPINDTQMTFEKITKMSDLDRFLSRVTDIIAFDTETTGLNHLTDKLVGISLAISESHGIYIPLRHKTNTNDLFSTETFVSNQLSVTDVLNKLWPIFINPNITKIGHNIKFDLHIFANEGWDIDKITNTDDTMLLSYILHGTSHQHNLDELAKKYLSHTNIKYSDLFPEKTRDADMHFDMLSPDFVTQYAAEDATIAFRLYKKMRPELGKNEKLQTLYEQCDLALLPILIEMERYGVLINQDKLRGLSIIFHNKLNQLEHEIWNLVGHEFNIASPKQLATVLFDELKLPSNKKRSTDADSLNDLIEQHPAIEKILNWRSVAKLAGTYADALPRQIASDGRIHTTYLQTSTNTARLSSRDPNLQNIPAKTDLGEEIRKCFIAPSNRVLISIDYSQIQLRLLADVANVKIFKDTFLHNTDIHEQTARKIFNIPNDTPVSKEQRRAAKTVNFSIIYGISSFGLSNQLNISRNEAKNIIDIYMTGLPEIREYINNVKDFVSEHSYVYTPWGRKIEIPMAQNTRMRAYAMRAAINAPIQGYEADLMRRAMISVYNKIIKPNKKQIRLIMQVHDEMIFECDTDVAEQFAKQIKYEMEHVAEISVPIPAEYIIANYWGK